MGWSKEELGEIISKHPLRSAAVMSFIVAGTTSLVVSNSGITTNGVVANGTVSIEPAGEATGFDASPLGILDGAVLPTPVVTAGSLNVLESAWDIDDKTARTIGWRLRTEGASGDSSNAPTTKLLIQSTADNSTWTTRATIDMTGALAGLASVAATTGTFSGDVAVNGEDITCDSASAATVFNTNATSGAMFGAATGSIDIAGGSGSTGVTIAGASGNITMSGDLAVNGGDITTTSVGTLTLFPSLIADLNIAGGYTNSGATLGPNGDFHASRAIQAIGIGMYPYIGAQTTVSTATWNQDAFVSIVKSDSWPDPAFGSSLLFKAENHNSATVEDQMRLRTEWTDATAGSVDSKFTVQLRTAGAALANALTVVGGVAGVSEFAGDLNVKGGDLTTTATTASLYNTTATTVNIGGAGEVNLAGTSADSGCTAQSSGGMLCALSVGAGAARDENNGVNIGLRMLHNLGTATAAAGLGHSIQWYAETSGTGAQESDDQATIYASWLDSAGDSEDSQLGIKLRTAGAALADVLTIVGTGITSFAPLVVGSLDTSATIAFGTQLVVNPDFAGNLAGWTAGAGWSYDAGTGTALHTPGSAETLTQNVTVAANTAYYIEVAWERGSGTASFSVGSTTLIDQAPVTMDLSVDWYSTSSTTVAVTITPSSDFSGYVYSIKMSPVTPSPASAITYKQSASYRPLEVRGNYASLFLGESAGINSTSAQSCLFVGLDAGRANIDGGANTYLGYKSGRILAQGQYNTFVGADTGSSARVASNSVLVGARAGYALTTGSNNTFLGSSAGSSTTTGRSNIMIGPVSATSATTNYQVRIGSSSGILLDGYNAADAGGTQLRGFQAAGDAGTDVELESLVTRTNGYILKVINNSVDLLRVAYDGFLEIFGDVSVTGSLAVSESVVIGTTGSASQSYLQIDSESGAPPVADCDTDAERGRTVIDYTNHRYYVCNGATRGWDYIDLVD